MAADDRRLPLALSGERRTVHTQVRALSFYRAGPVKLVGDDGDRPPMLLIHSVNAAGSAYEMRPLYERYRAERTVYAIDLPGFGFSDRSDRTYTPRLMTDAIHEMVAVIRREHAGQAVDALALSLSSEFLARAASERPDGFRSLAFVSPTGFDARGPYRDAPGSTRARPAFYRTLRFPLWDRGFFRLLTSRPSIRYFLQRTFGSKSIDEGLLEYDHLTARQPGGRYAPYYFVSGYLFSRDITRVYESLKMPVWLSHGVRGDFQDYSTAREILKKENWTATVFSTGALPHFERIGEFVQAYDRFLARGAT